MFYFKDDIYVIRSLTYEDCFDIANEEIKQGWDQDVKKYLDRLEDFNNHKCLSMVVEYKGNLSGYINLYFKGIDGPTNLLQYPEIVDLGVFEKYRNNGIGNRLLAEVEKVAKINSDIVYLGVGLHSGYGEAQRIYVKRGYIPDGTGVWYKNKECLPYSDCVNDDDLIIYMTKKLR